MNQFKNKVLYIESNEMLEEVRELIEESGESFKLPKKIKNNNNYLYFYKWTNRFGLGEKCRGESEITLEEFKELLKQG